jgi:stage V sporulation protein G
MNITEIKLRKMDNDSKMKAIGSITLDDCFVVTGIKVIEGSKGLFISMPNRKTPEGDYKDVCFPLSAEYRQYITDEVLAKYNEVELTPVNTPDDLPF